MWKQTNQNRAPYPGESRRVPQDRPSALFFHALTHSPQTYSQPGGHRKAGDVDPCAVLPWHKSRTLATTRAWRPAGGDVTGIGHPVRMRLATWNVNSLRARLPRLLD